MNRKEDYRDMEKYHKACQRQHRRYYSKTSFLYPSHPWTAEEGKESGRVSERGRNRYCVYQFRRTGNTGGERPWIQEYPRCKQFCIRTQKSFQLLIKISD